MQTQRSLGGRQLQSTHLSSRHGSGMGQRIVYPRASQHIKKRPCRILTLSVAEVLYHAQMGITTDLVLLCVDKPPDPPRRCVQDAANLPRPAPTPSGVLMKTLLGVRLHVHP